MIKGRKECGEKKGSTSQSHFREEKGTNFGSETEFHQMFLHGRLNSSTNSVKKQRKEKQEKSLSRFL